MTDLDARLARGPLRVRSVWTEESPDRLERRVLRRRRSLFAVDVVAVCVCAAIALVLVGHHAWRTRGANGTPIAQVVNVGGVTAFADGSVAEASSRDSVVQVEEESATRVVTRLEGGARFHVAHDPMRTFEVRAGDVRVRVLGTVFSVQQLASGQSQVLVERGRVEVAWLGGALVLESGQGGAFPPEPDVTAPPPPETAPPATTVDAPPSAEGPHRVPAPRAAGSGTGWRDAARTGNYDRAYEELRARGRDAVRDDAADLMLAADVARLSAHPEDAVKPLHDVYERHASDRRAPVAAFTLGRVLEDDLARPSEAANAFRKARMLWPAGPLAEDALAREAEAWARGGRSDAARAAASDYVSQYPQGRHVGAMRKILGP